MRSQLVHVKFLIATVAVVLAALVGPMTAGAGGEFVPGVTDSTTGVLAELDDDRFIPGVTDSTTGVLRELERKGLEPQGVGPTQAGDSGFDYDAAVAVGGAFAAMAAGLALLALLAAARRRRVAI